ncbi:MAG TPA: cyclodeaminase/cyclohydrolase family protein [Flavobacterium sp.]|jgi:Zn-dependent peptidase ImmA (M78 family)/formiminotetrahydrofolate cyclodeaminase
MELDFSKLTVQKLLDKLGRGGHKPGSGSAAALEAMISAKLLQTVISITNRKKYQETYKAVLPRLLIMSGEIENDIFPRLADLFQQDAFYFDKAIKARKATSKAAASGDFYETSFLRKQEVDNLKMPVRIPLEIAELSIRLARISVFVFENAFRSARGDSHVALGGAISSIAGSMSIVQLNFLSFKIYHFFWTKEMSNWYDTIKIEYESLKNEVDRCMKILEDEVSDRLGLYSDIQKFLERYKVDGTWSDIEIETLATDFQNILWKHRLSIFGKSITEARQILHPQRVFENVFDYDFGEFPILENDDNGSECAGFIDQRERQVVLSKHYSAEVQNFTAAHELGHALLHNQTVLHRDIPLDGSHRETKSSTEKQADKFASYFLMPRKEVEKQFLNLFGTKKLTADGNTAFDLIRNGDSELRKRFKNRRELAIKIASTEMYAGKPFRSISKQFNVSVTAMARRLEELNLVEY